MSRTQRTGPRTRHQRTDRGAVLILTSVAMIAMMCFAGLAIDMGVVRSQRAQYQATADAAALYATYLIRQPGADLQQVAAATRSFVAQNLDLDNGTADSTWANCADAKKLATVSTRDAGIHNDCISFDVSGGTGSAQARVRLPMLQVKPIIGLGVLKMDVTAVAGAEGSGAGCDAFGVSGCATTTTAAPTTTAPPTSVWQTTTTVRPTTTVPGPTTTKKPSPTTTKKPTTTTIPSPTTTKAPSPTTTKKPATTTTTTPKPTTTPAPTTTAPPVPTTLDIGF